MRESSCRYSKKSNIKADIQMKERIVFLDTIKGFAILLVVMGHTIAWTYPNWENICLFNQQESIEVMIGGVLWQIIYTFHMALFFMVSGYLIENSSITKRAFFQKLKAKTLRLLLPYLATGYLIYFVRGTWGYWFLLSLYELSILGLLVNICSNHFNRHHKFINDVLLLGVIYLILRVFTVIPVTSAFVDYGLVKYFIPFFFGFLFKKYEMLQTIVKHPYTFTTSLVLFVLFFISRYLTLVPALYLVISKLDYFLSLHALLGCIVFFHLFMKGINKQIEVFLIYLGKHSMPIYILHNLFVIQITGIGLFILHQNPVTSITLQILYSFLVGMVAIGLCILTYKFLYRSSAIRLLMFGES